MTSRFPSAQVAPKKSAPTEAAPMMRRARDPHQQPLVIRHADSLDDRQRIFRFRYEIYVEEMGRHQKYADHSARTVVEPFDATGHLFLAMEGDRIVGTAR